MTDRRTTSTTTDEPTVPGSALSIRNVSKHFDDVLAVAGVSVDVAGAELLALVGPSGCGKSTLLRMIAGLVPIESGRVELGGVVADDGRRCLPPEQRGIGLVFQEHALFPHLSVEKNIGFGVRTTKSERSIRVAEMLELVGLGAYADRYPHELSGGERQRVALARALAPDPDLLLLDEPFASLDPNLRAQVRGEVVDVLRSTGTAAVFVTHDQAEALAVGDRIAVMRDGRILQVDGPDAVFHRPSDRFVAAFMGEADFMTAAALRVDVGMSTAGTDAAGRMAPLADDEIVMLRPDDVGFVVDDAGSAHVVRAEFRGSSWCYTLRLDSGSTIRSMRSHTEAVPVGTTVAPMIAAGHRPVVIPST